LRFSAPFREEIMTHNYQPPQQQRHAFLSVMFTVLALGLFLFVLIFISGGFFLWVILLGGTIFGVALLHYVLWGRAFSASVAGEREEEQLRQRAAAAIDEDDDWQTPDTRIRR
jgi:hypothetical protein